MTASIVAKRGIRTINTAYTIMWARSKTRRLFTSQRAKLVKMCEIILQRGVEVSSTGGTPLSREAARGPHDSRLDDLPERLDCVTLGQLLHREPELG